MLRREIRNLRRNIWYTLCREIGILRRNIWYMLCQKIKNLCRNLWYTLRREIRMLRQILGIHSAEILSFLGAFCLSSHISPCLLPPKINNLQPILPIPQFNERVEIFQAIFMINSMPKYSN